jgi:transposase
VQQAGTGEILCSRIGPYLRSLAVWLRNAIGISYRKIPRIIEEMYGVTFTPAALIGFETMLAEKAQPIVDDIGKKLASSDGAVHADETYWTTNGARSYFWVHADANFVLFQYDTSRSGQVSRDILGIPASGSCFSTTREFPRPTIWPNALCGRWSCCERSRSAIAATPARSGWQR